MLRGLSFRNAIRTSVITHINKRTVFNTTHFSHMPYCARGRNFNDDDTMSEDQTTMTKSELAKIIGELESLHEIVKSYKQSVTNKSEDDLAKDLPKEIHIFFNAYTQETLEGITRNLPKNAHWPILLKRQISEEIPSFVSAFLNELLIDIKKYSTKDFTKLKYKDDTKN